MELRQNILSTFQERFHSDPDYFARAPGRVNLLGEHVDYNDGFVLPAAIDRETLVAFSMSGTQRSTILALDIHEETTFDPLSIEKKHDSKGMPLLGWRLYPASVMWALKKAGLETSGIQAVFASDVPIGAGLSSSASVELAFCVAWEMLGGWILPPISRAKIGLQAETQYVGVNCGIMDQFASACGVKNRLLYLDCRSLDWRTVRLPKDVAIVIADTSVRRSLSDTGYNDRHSACEEAVRILKKYLPGISALRDVTLVQYNHYSDRLPGIVAKRARHIIEEIARTETAVGLLENKEISKFGELMNNCHISLRDLYEVSCPELNIMVELAQSLPGCYGARLTGGGFGGCTVNLVERKASERFSNALADGYTKMTGLNPEIYICRAANGAGVENV